MITVKTFITFKDFLNFNLKNSLPRLVIFSLIILLFLGLNLYDTGSDVKEVFRTALFWLLIMLIFITVRSYFRLKNAFYSNKKIQEEIIYVFDQEKVNTRGETFDGEFTWDFVHKVKENKDWFLIYQSAQTMNMVPKKFFTKDQISQLRNIIKSNQVKAKLRKN